MLDFVKTKLDGSPRRITYLSLISFALFLLITSSMDIDIDSKIISNLNEKSTDYSFSIFLFLLAFPLLSSVVPKNGKKRTLQLTMLWYVFLLVFIPLYLILKTDEFLLMHAVGFGLFCFVAIFLVTKTILLCSLLKTSKNNTGKRSNKHGKRRK